MCYRFNHTLHMLCYRFSDTLHVCLSQICGYRQLVAEVEGVRRVQYSSDNLDHEELLMRVSNWYPVKTSPFKIQTLKKNLQGRSKILQGRS